MTAQLSFTVNAAEATMVVEMNIDTIAEGFSLVADVQESTSKGIIKIAVE